MWKGKSQRRIQHTAEEVYLPILIIPGIASSGLHIVESSLNDKYQGRRIWMNAAFLAACRLDKKVLNEDEINSARSQSKDLDFGVGALSWLSKASDTVFAAANDGGDDEAGYNAAQFATEEEELEIKNAWIHHMALDKNMVDEKPGNKIRVYEGVSISFVMTRRKESDLCGIHFGQMECL